MYKTKSNETIPLNSNVYQHELNDSNFYIIFLIILCVFIIIFCIIYIIWLFLPKTIEYFSKY